jgi:diguanylate cyclase (GGDEF)-like protein
MSEVRRVKAGNAKREVGTCGALDTPWVPELVRRANSRPDARMEAARRILQSPARVATVFWMAGSLSALCTALSTHWTHRELVELHQMSATCLVPALIFGLAGTRLPRWSLHVGGAASLAMVTVATSIGIHGDVDMAVLYIWILIYAALFFSPGVAFVYAAAVGTAYGLLLGLGPPVESAFASWLVIVGTGTFSGIVVLGLVTFLRADASLDHLTNLANRRTWDNQLEGETERARRSGAALSVAIIDIDDFEAINDLRGHDEGDGLLQDLSTAWQPLVRSFGDLLARLGGDEFGVLAPATDEAGMRHLVGRLIEATPTGLICSIGTATWDGEESAGDLTRRADLSMFLTKADHHRVRTDGIRG